jgi:spore coat protein A
VAPPLHPESLAKFVDPLPIPEVMKPEGTRPDPTDPSRQVPYYRVAMRPAEVRIHRDVPPTRVWSYAGSTPGPTIEARRGEGALVEWVNELPDRHFLPVDHSLHGAHDDAPEVRTVVHVHGAKVPAESDGFPDSWYTAGRSATHHYPNRQDAATLWYHDHAMGIERLNQYAGLFGFYLLRDDAEDALGLPRGAYEVPLAICDRMFYADGQLRYPSSPNDVTPWVPEVYGDASLVNGKLYPFLEVEPRSYRLRVLNASNTRTYTLSLSSGRAFRQIGTDQGLLPAAVPMKSVTVGPAERVDLVADFADDAGRQVVLQNGAFQVMQFRVGAAGAGRAVLPAKLRDVPRIPASAAVKTRKLTLNEYEDPKTRRMTMLLDGKYWREPVTETPELDTVEIWSLVNLTEDTHPIHLHLVRFQLLDRQRYDPDAYQFGGALNAVGPRMAPDPHEVGWKDTIRCDPGIITRIIARFEGYAGRYVWHCHLLEHAANEMMRPFEVVPRAKG